MCSTMENVILSHWDKITSTVGVVLSSFEEQYLMFELASQALKLITWEINQVLIQKRVFRSCLAGQFQGLALSRGYTMPCLSVLCLLDRDNLAYSPWEHIQRNFNSIVTLHQKHCGILISRNCFNLAQFLPLFSLFMLISTSIPIYLSCASHIFHYELDFVGERPQLTVCMPYLCPREWELTNGPAAPTVHKTATSLSSLP